MKRLLLCLVVLASATAHATTSSCADANDGTPCSDTCIIVGTCMSHVCKPSLLRANGTPCSTDDPCTVSDQCLNGVCVAGTPVTCPDQDACLVGVCSPRIGCTVKDICPPDLASPPDLADADLPPADLAPPPPDLLGADLCTVPSGSEFFSCDDPPDGFFASDGGADASAAFHVRGSRVGDCALGGGELGAPFGALLVLAFVAALLRRRAA